MRGILFTTIIYPGEAMATKYSDKQVIAAIEEAKKTLSRLVSKTYEPLVAIQEGEMWQHLTSSQKTIVIKAFS